MFLNYECRANITFSFSHLNFNWIHNKIYAFSPAFRSGSFIGRAMGAIAPLKKKHFWYRNVFRFVITLLGLFHGDQDGWESFLLPPSRQASFPFILVSCNLSTKEHLRVTNLQITICCVCISENINLKVQIDNSLFDSVSVLESGNSSSFSSQNFRSALLILVKSAGFSITIWFIIHSFHFSRSSDGTK